MHLEVDYIKSHRSMLMVNGSLPVWWALRLKPNDLWSSSISRAKIDLPLCSLSPKVYLI